ncbi:MAG: 50S ribosomal protein L6 [Patescibacteria group bacterium]|nr:MAG: 50S ribosomal protein L6 [Patescibacteria group bacterium]
MSRIGKKLIQVPAGVDVAISETEVRVKGPKGELKLALHPHVRLERAGDVLTVAVKSEENKKDRALWGLFNRLVANMIVGVTKGYEKGLEFVGVGYKVSLAGKTVKMDVGFSHEVDFPLPAGIEAKVDKNTLTLSGIDKQLVGETAARIRRIRKPEPYKGKGIKYVDEVIRRKAGKSAKAGAK